jgi:hypothetical protein
MEFIGYFPSTTTTPGKEQGSTSIPGHPKMNKHTWPSEPVTHAGGLQAALKRKAPEVFCKHAAVSECGSKHPQCNHCNDHRDTSDFQVSVAHWQSTIDSEAELELARHSVDSKLLSVDAACHSRDGRHRVMLKASDSPAIIAQVPVVAPVVATLAKHPLASLKQSHSAHSSGENRATTIIQDNYCFSGAETASASDSGESEADDHELVEFCDSSWYGYFEEARQYKAN